MGLGRALLEPALKDTIFKRKRLDYQPLFPIRASKLDSSLKTEIRTLFSEFTPNDNLTDKISGISSPTP